MLSKDDGTLDINGAVNSLVTKLRYPFVTMMTDKDQSESKALALLELVDSQLFSNMAAKTGRNMTLPVTNFKMIAMEVKEIVRRVHAQVWRGLDSSER